MNHHRLDDPLVVVLVAVNVVSGAQDLRVDRAVAVDDLEQLVEELNPLLFLLEVDAVAELLVQQLRFDDHSDDARHNKLKVEKVLNVLDFELFDSLSPCSR